MSAHDLEVDLANVDGTGLIWAWLDHARDTSVVRPGAVLTLADGEDVAMGQVVDLVQHDEGTIVHLRVLPRLFVDYSLVGHDHRFTTPVRARDRAGLTVGDIVTVVGDDGPDAGARIVFVSLDATDVELELLP